MKSVSGEIGDGQGLLASTAMIVSAMQGGPAAVSHEQLNGLISSVASALRVLSAKPSEIEETSSFVPAVSIRKSIGEDYIVCLEDGKRLKMLKRYLNSRFGLSPEQYRRKWGLPSDYPMTAPSHSKRRSNLAKQNRLGHKAEAEATR